MRIVVDTYNLSKKGGTGVASYARGFTNVARRQGHEVALLTSEILKSRGNALMENVALADSERSSGGLIRRKMGKIWGSMRALAGNPVHPFTPVGEVHGGVDRLPEADLIWNSPDIFRRAIGAYRTTGRTTKIDIPGADLVHWTYPLPISARNAANVYTIHDLVPLKIPEATLDDKDRYYRLCKRIVDQADHILTVSEASRSDIVNMLNADPAKVSNTYQACDVEPELLSRSLEEEAGYVKGVFDLDWKSYFLFFGAIEPKKNIGRIIEAYLASRVAAPLVIVGAPGWKSEDEMRLLDSLRHTPMAKQILQVEYLPRSTLVSLIRGAKSVLFPSLYEGFGLPVLEAMSLGTAVITSTAGSLPEVGGDAAPAVDPYDTTALMRAIQQMDGDQEFRLQCEARGRVQARLFSAEAYGARLSEVFRQFGTMSVQAPWSNMTNAVNGEQQEYQR